GGSDGGYRSGAHAEWRPEHHYWGTAGRREQLGLLPVRARVAQRGGRSSRIVTTPVVRHAGRPALGQHLRADADRQLTSRRSVLDNRRFASADPYRKGSLA